METDQTFNDIGLACQMMLAHVPPVENSASIKLASDKILTSRKHDKQLAQMVLDYGDTGQWPPLNDMQKVILAIRLTYAFEFCAGHATMGNQRQFSRREMFSVIASLITDRWHRLAGLWLLQALELEEALGLSFARPAYRKPSKMLQEAMKEYANK